jgi:hypothetical protein
VKFELLLELKIEQKHGTSLVKLVLSRRKSGLRTEYLSVPVILGEYRDRSTRNSPNSTDIYISSDKFVMNGAISMEV